MRIDFDPDKRTLTERGLDFARAAEVFAGRHFTCQDTRAEYRYGEPRHITLGKFDERRVVMVWTPRGEARRIISMSKANEGERARYAHRVD